MNKNKSSTDGDNHAPNKLNRHSGNPGLHSFGYWRFSADSGDLYDGKSTTRLEPQVAKLLNYFLLHQRKVVSREELIAAVWENRVVSDDAINRCVSILRHILSPQDKHAYIETVVRKGYIAHFPASTDIEPPATQRFGRRKHLYLVAIAGVVGIILYLVAGNIGDPSPEFRKPARTGPPMVAVLPFTVSSRGDESEFFAVGMHNDLLTQLARLQSMRVISSTSVMEYQNITRNMRTIGAELGADVILEGHVQIGANHIRINAQLIDTHSDEHLWAETYDRELSPANIFEVQGEIARTIAKELNTTLTAQDKEELALIPTENMAAYRAYHRAMQMRDSGSSQVGSPEYLGALQQAVALDPNFSLAWGELVSTLAFLNIAGDSPEMTIRAEQALGRLRAVAPDSSDHLIGQAAYVYYSLKDYNRAHDLIVRALVMNPSNVRAVQLKSWIERRQGNFEAYLNSKKQARDLDPRNPTLTGILVQAMYMTHQYDEALVEIESSPLESDLAKQVQNLLLYREHRDFNRLQESMRELCAFKEGADCGWSAYIANRNYRGALAALDPIDSGIEFSGLALNDRSRIFTHWLMKDDAVLAQDLPRWQDLLARDRDSSGVFHRTTSHVGQALLAGIQGNAEEAQRLIEQWFHLQPIDWADRSVAQHEACRVLGMIGATGAAVKCIRGGLQLTSYVAPFFEPYLPFYDSMRDERAFIDMLAEFDGPKQQI